MLVCPCVIVQQEHKDTQVKLQSQSQKPKLEELVSPGIGFREVRTVCRLCPPVEDLCSNVIRHPVILPCNMLSLRTHKGGQRRVWRMSCLLRILTGAGNVGRTQCECSQIKADKRKGGVFIPTPSVYLQVLCCFQGDIAMVLIKTSLVQKLW